MAVDPIGRLREFGDAASTRLLVVIGMLVLVPHPVRMADRKATQAKTIARLGL